MLDRDRWGVAADNKDAPNIIVLVKDGELFKVKIAYQLPTILGEDYFTIIVNAVIMSAFTDWIKRN